MIDLTDKQDILRYHVRMERMMQALERTHTKENYKLLHEQFINVSKALEHGQTMFNYRIDQSTGKWNLNLRNQYKRAATLFNKEAFKHLGIKGTSIKSPLDEFWREFNIWSVQIAATKVMYIQTATKNQIAKIISKYMGEGLSHRDIAKKIEKTSKTINKTRALRIARTETHTAAVRSVHGSVRSTRIEYEKQWSHSADERVRSDLFNHRIDERVSMEAMFKGTGETLQYPGDPSGSAGNIINCRCIVIYHRVRNA